MTKTALLAAAAVIALSAGGASAKNAPTISTKSVAHTTAKSMHKVSPFSVLYDQTSNDSGIGINSQNFESSFASVDDQAADDFTVPKGSTWKVTEVDATGVYYNGSGAATSENVIFYKKGKHQLPGKVAGEFDNVVGTDNGSGSFAITLPGKGLKLKAGTYWVSVVANMDFEATGQFGGNKGQWGWENQTTSEGNPAAWRQPTDYFATGCTSWEAEDVCIPDGQGDHMFAIVGTSK